MLEKKNVEVRKNMFKKQVEYVEDEKIGASAYKKERLNKIIVTASSGKRFYADPVSRTDISDAILEAMDMGATDEDVTLWKTPDGFMNVTVAELKEARRLGLEAKANIVGVVNV